MPLISKGIQIGMLALSDKLEKLEKCVKQSKTLLDKFRLILVCQQRLENIFQEPLNSFLGFRGSEANRYANKNPIWDSRKHFFAIHNFLLLIKFLIFDASDHQQNF